MMKVIHFPECPSTQDYLKNNLPQLLRESPLQDGQILVSTAYQTQGRGRYSHTWHSYLYSLAFSFALRAAAKVSLTSHELGVLIAQFFRQRFSQNLYLKWPNDVLNAQRQKCAGILIHNVDLEYLVVGVGINLLPGPGEMPKGQYKVPMGHALNVPPQSFFEQYPELQTTYSSALPIEIYRYILENRKSVQEIVESWNEHCLHLHEHVVIEDQGSSQEGKFLGLGADGEALLLPADGNQESVTRLYSGHLMIHESGPSSFPS